MPNAEALITQAVGQLAQRRHGDGREVGLDSDLFDDLELDSLDVAELSALLEEELGTDPYTEGVVPRSIRDVVAFYDPTPA